MTDMDNAEAWAAQISPALPDRRAMSFTTTDVPAFRARVIREVEQIVRAVSKLVGGAGGEDAGERVFAEADRARQAVAHASLNMKRVTQKEADAAAAQDAVEEEDE